LANCPPTDERIEGLEKVIFSLFYLIQNPFFDNNTIKGVANGINEDIGGR
jgi:hypothetical protein